MKKLKYVLILIAFLLYGFTKSTGKTKIKVSTKSEQKKISKSVHISNKNDIDIKYLITNSSAGYFELGGNWKAIAKNYYNYQSLKGETDCHDDCCSGAFDLGYNLIKAEEGFVINPVLNIGLEHFEVSNPRDHDNKKKYINRKDLFYLEYGQCPGWYWYDKISNITVFSDKFKTKEGVGVGTTLKDFEKIFGRFIIEIGWMEEQQHAIRINIKNYPDISFVIDFDDYKGEDYSAISFKYLTISDFKKDAKIACVLIGRGAFDGEQNEKALNDYLRSDYVKISDEISSHFDKWLTKEEFEKTESYNLRLKQSKVVFDSICYLTFNKKLEEKHKTPLSVKLGTYDAHKELFPYTLKINDTIINDSLKVAGNEARNFKENFKDFKILVPISGSLWGFFDHNLVPMKLKFDGTKIVLKLPKELSHNKLRIDSSELILKNTVDAFSFDYETYEAKLKEIKELKYNQIITTANEFENKKDLKSCLSNLENALKIKSNEELINRIKKLKNTILTIQVKNLELSDLNNQIKNEYNDAILFSTNNLSLLKEKNKKATLHYELAFNLLKKKCDQYEDVLASGTISKDNIEWNATHELLLETLQKKRESIKTLRTFDERILKLIQNDEVKIIKKTEAPEELIEIIINGQTY